MGTWNYRSKNMGAFVATAIMVGCNDGPQFQNGNRNAYHLNELDALPSAVESFSVSAFQDRKLQWDAKSSTVSDTLSLVKGPRSFSLYNQIERTMYQDGFVQGGDGAAKRQTFAIKEAGHLDLLIVVDNSDTMKDHQMKLATKLGPILSNIGNTNWRIAFVTTDRSCVHDVLTRQDYEADENSLQARFVQAVSVTPGTNGSTVERGIQMAIEGFLPNASCAAANGFVRNEWTRSDSSKVVLIVSDEENCGSAINDGCERNGYVYRNPDYFMTNGPKNAKVFGILPNFDTSRGPICDADYDEPAVKEYIDLVSRTGGKYTSICENDYTNILTSMSSEVGQIIHRSFTLDAVPDSGSLQIKVDGAIITSGYTLVGKTIDVEGGAISANSTTIEFNYLAGTAERTDTLALREIPDVSTFSVTMDNQLISQDRYNYDSVRNALVFTPLPSDRKIIAVRYRADEVLPNNFEMPTGAARASIKIQVDRHLLHRDQYQLNEDGQIVFQTPPQDGSEVQIEYFRSDSLQTNYPVETGLMEFSQTVTVIGEGEKLTTAIVGDREVIIDSEDVARLDRISIVYSFINPSDFKRITLPNETIGVQWTAGADIQPLLQCGNPEISVDSVVDLSCFVQKYETFTATYQIVVERHSSFELTHKITDKSKLTVQVDGKEFDSYTIQGQVLTIDRSKVSDQSIISVRFD